MPMKKINIALDRAFNYNDLYKLAKAMCTNKPLIQFSIFKTNEVLSDSKQWIVNAPDIDSTEPAIAGKVQFMTDYWRVSDMPVYSEVVENPTWMTIINIFNDMMQIGDEFGSYLEGLIHDDDVGDVKIIKFAIGS